MKSLSLIVFPFVVSLTFTSGCGPTNQVAPDSETSAAASEQLAQQVEDAERAHQAEISGKKRK